MEPSKLHRLETGHSQLETTDKQHDTAPLNTLHRGLYKLDGLKLNGTDDPESKHTHTPNKTELSDAREHESLDNPPHGRVKRGMDNISKNHGDFREKLGNVIELFKDGKEKWDNFMDHGGRTADNILRAGHDKTEIIADLAMKMLGHNKDMHDPNSQNNGSDYKKHQTLDKKEAPESQGNTLEHESLEKPPVIEATDTTPEHKAPEEDFSKRRKTADGTFLRTRGNLFEGVLHDEKHELKSEALVLKRDAESKETEATEIANEPKPHARRGVDMRTTGTPPEVKIAQDKIAAATDRVKATALWTENKEIRQEEFGARKRKRG
jgi:hypothetical protein